MLRPKWTKSGVGYKSRLFKLDVHVPDSWDINFYFHACTDIGGKRCASSHCLVIYTTQTACVGFYYTVYNSPAIKNVF